MYSILLLTATHLLLNSKALRDENSRVLTDWTTLITSLSVLLSSSKSRKERFLTIDTRSSEEFLSINCLVLSLTLRIWLIIPYHEK